MWKSVVYLGLTIVTYTHSMHTQIFHPLSSINTSSVRVTQQINHHGYSNIIIAVLKVHSDWWCLWDHLNVSNEESNNLHPFNNIISDWRLSWSYNCMVASWVSLQILVWNHTVIVFACALQADNLISFACALQADNYKRELRKTGKKFQTVDFHHLKFKWKAPILIPTMAIKLQIKFWLINMNELWWQNMNPSWISRTQAQCCTTLTLNI